MSRYLSNVVFSLALSAGLLVPHAVAAQDMAAAVGSWESSQQTQRGNFTQVITIELKDGMLVGSVSGGRGGEVPLANIKFEGGTLTFEIVREFNGNTRTQVVTAKIDGDTMEGTMSGGRGGGRPFTAKRST